MANNERVARAHLGLSRRFFMQLASTGVIAACELPAWADTTISEEAALADVVAKLKYLTKVEDFRIVGRGKPVPSTLSPEKRLAVGLDRRTWKLSVTADVESKAQIANPMTIEQDNALDWNGLMAIARDHAVRYMKVMTCTNIGQTLGMGLWEGVPLRHIIWMAKPLANVRRVFYYGYHNDDPAQRFQSSLSINRVLEDPPGEKPVMLCFKLNGEWLTPAEGAPVRVIVPEAYGNKSVKWLQHIVLTNNDQLNDTYATWNNDTESHLKTYANFLMMPTEAKSNQPIPLTGLAQVGMSGLSKVQYAVFPKAAKWPEDDPHFTNADWRDARVLPPPDSWGGGLPNGKLPPIPSQIDPATGKPTAWPLRDTIVHWAALAPGLPPGRYVIRCRTIDANGKAQPMPRPLPKSGHNQIQSKPLLVRDLL